MAVPLLFRAVLTMSEWFFKIRFIRKTKETPGHIPGVSFV